MRILKKLTVLTVVVAGLLFFRATSAGVAMAEGDCPNDGGTTPTTPANPEPSPSGGTGGGGTAETPGGTTTTPVDQDEVT